MTKLTAKFLVAGAAAALAIAMSVAPTEAAKKRAKMSRGCAVGALCSTNCGAAGCFMNYCGNDGKWYPAILTPVCVGSLCPQQKC
jgi:hypothetical protein